MTRPEIQGVLERLEGYLRGFRDAKGADEITAKQCLAAASALCGDLNRRRIRLSKKERQRTEDDWRLAAGRLEALSEQYRQEPRVISLLEAYVYAWHPDMEAFRAGGKPKRV